MPLTAKTGKIIVFVPSAQSYKNPAKYGELKPIFLLLITV